jgi:hypothetical protein
MTGVAAGTLMNGMTLHSCFDLKVIEDKYYSSGSFQEPLTAEKVYYLRQVINPFHNHCIVLIGYAVLTVSQCG